LRIKHGNSLFNLAHKGNSPLQIPYAAISFHVPNRSAFDYIHSCITALYSREPCLV